MPSRQHTWRVPQSVWWTRQQSHLPPPARASGCTWGTVCCVPERLASRWWDSSADRRRWARPRACVGLCGGGTQSLCVQPPCTQFHLQAPAWGKTRYSTLQHHSPILIRLHDNMVGTTAILLSIIKILIRNKGWKTVLDLKYSNMVSPVSYHQNKGCPQ